MVRDDHPTFSEISVKVSFTHVKKQNTSFYIKDAARHVVGEYHPLFRWSVSDARVYIYLLYVHIRIDGVFSFRKTETPSIVDCEAAITKDDACTVYSTRVDTIYSRVPVLHIFAYLLYTVHFTFSPSSHMIRSNSHEGVSEHRAWFYLVYKIVCTFLRCFVI